MKLPGFVLPDFSLLDNEGNAVTRADLLGKKTVLWFYPKAATPGWTKQGCGFRDRIQDYESLGISVYGVSFDNVEANSKFAGAQGFTFPLLSDVNRELALGLGVVTDRDARWANRMTFIIDEKGRVIHAEETKDVSGQAAHLLDLLRWFL